MVFGLATTVFGLSTSIPPSIAALVVLGAADAVSVVLRVAGTAEHARPHAGPRVP